MKNEQAIELVQAINQLSLEHSETSGAYLKQILLEIFGQKHSENMECPLCNGRPCYLIGPKDEEFICECKHPHCPLKHTSSNPPKH